MYNVHSLPITNEQLLTAVVHYCMTTIQWYWMLLTTTDHYSKVLLNIADTCSTYCCIHIANNKHYWLLLTITKASYIHEYTGGFAITNYIYHCWPLLTTADQYAILLTTNINYWPLPIITNYYISLLTTTDHYWPLETLINNYHIECC